VCTYVTRYVTSLKATQVLKRKLLELSPVPATGGLRGEGTSRGVLRALNGTKHTPWAQ
jgi:hypothetical protein